MLRIKKRVITLIIFAFSSTFILAQKGLGTSAASRFTMPPNLKVSDYMSQTIVIKVRSNYRSICSSAMIEDAVFKQLYNSIGGKNLRKKFPYTKPPASLVNRYGQHLADLSLIYEFNYSANAPLEKIINKFSSIQLFEYAEPHYIPHLCYTPNDPDLTFQYAITNVRADSAWGINTTTARGDTNIVIGITDTGTEPTHDDLKNQIKHNYADIPDGTDDDGDGYIDNFSGWDLGEDDNDPTWTVSPHGVHTSGIAAAEVDNAIGVAGIGFHCKFLPVKIADAGGGLTMAYEGITYAADHGCAVINCSWGGAAGGQLGQDVVTYATINKNVLVVAAAGNDQSDELFYPASFDYVLSVANTKNDDTRSTSSNWNYSVDVCAPGENIYSTYPTNTFSFQTGTSMASPCVAGAAAIVKSFYPSYNALQLGERLKTTCDNIYPLMSSTYQDKLGNGRINLYKALTQSQSPSITMSQRVVTDNNDGAFQIGDTLRISGNYTNYLGPAANVTATLSSASVYVNIIDGSTTLGALATMGTTTNNTDPYQIIILAGTPQDQQITFKLTYTDAITAYTAVEYFTVVVNVNYVNITVNDVATTISGRGRIGYNMDGQIGGLGFNYLNKGTIIYDAGFMVGIDSSHVSDVIRGTGGATNDADFQSMVNIQHVVPSVFSDFDVDGKFNDNPAAAPLPVNVHQQAFAWTSTGDRKYVIVQYIISNTGATTLNNLYAGICADWDIDNVTYGSDRAAFDATTQMGYAYYSGTNGIYGGIKLLTKTAPVNHYAIDNVAGGAGGVDLYSGGYDSGEKYTTLFTNRSDAGVSGAGADILDVVSTGPYSIAAGDSVRVAFALIAGDSLTDIKKSAVNAQIKYDGVITGISNNSVIKNTAVMSIYPNPTNGESMININVEETASVELKVFNLLGEEIKTIISEKMQAGSYHFIYDTSVLNNGLYYYRLSIGNKKYIDKLIVNK